jgi:hypothetical protein
MYAGCIYPITDRESDVDVAGTAESALDTCLGGKNVYQSTVAPHGPQQHYGTTTRTSVSGSVLGNPI